KINGKKAYEIAREGKAVELKSKEIEIYDLKLINCFEDNNFVFEISCSSGTYIRSLCRDIAYKLATYGTMLSIIRTKCGSFNLEDSCTLKDIEEGKISYLEV
ncbi:MAG: tRNA pseudouridine(55) synthase TruB, partial [Clostridia bacterium]|nr:tRNA pseudouridine(55) synthase TruB [Clostridia bacterium]